MGLAEHRLAAAIVAAAAAATVAVFTFARPEYHLASSGGALAFPEAKAPAHGWTWSGGTPGFRFGQDRDAWNISLLRPAELASARRDAAAAGLAPATLGVLEVLRTEPGVRPAVLVAGSDASGRTCIGAQLHSGPASFSCPPELGRDVGLVVAEATPPHGPSRGMFLMGVSRADVTRVTIETPGATYVDARGSRPVVRPVGPVAVYERRPLSWWGTFLQTTLQPRRWHARLTFYGARGELASADVRFDKAGEKAVVVR